MFLGLVAHSSPLSPVFASENKVSSALSTRKHFHRQCLHGWEGGRILTMGDVIAQVATDSLPAWCY